METPLQPNHANSKNCHSCHHTPEGDGPLNQTSQRVTLSNLIGIHLGYVKKKPKDQGFKARRKKKTHDASDGDAAFLFSSDEEANDPRCIAAFLARGLPYEAVLVAEPTMSEAVLAHRGISSVLMQFAGRAGHASGKQDVAASALHQAMRWGNRALDHVESLASARFGGLTGLRFNIGRVEGGIKANMIAPAAEVRFGFRPLPSMDIDALLATFAGFAEPQAALFTETFRGPSLPAGDIAEAENRRLLARDVADALDLPIGNAVDFWTEASLFSAGGYTTLVFGPGDIAQAHTADEFVTLEQLQRYTDAVHRIIAAGA